MLLTANQSIQETEDNILWPLGQGCSKIGGINDEIQYNKI